MPSGSGHHCIVFSSFCNLASSFNSFRVRRLVLSLTTKCISRRYFSVFYFFGQSLAVLPPERPHSVDPYPVLGDPICPAWL